MNTPVTTAEAISVLGQYLSRTHGNKDNVIMVAYEGQAYYLAHNKAYDGVPIPHPIPENAGVYFTLQKVEDND